MKVTLVAVMSINAKITNGQLPPAQWASAEDQTFFRQRIKENSLIVMGSKTYQNSKPNIVLETGKLRIVLTSTPEKFQKETVPGQLEFSKESPAELQQRCAKLGYSEMLLVGGGEINAAFLKENVVDELQLTIEPEIFAEGVNLNNGAASQTQFYIASIQKLNKNGSVLITWKRS